MLRDGSDYDANVTAMEFTIKNKGNTYGLSGNGAYNYKKFTDHTEDGYKYYLRFSKLAGDWTYGTFFNYESDTYDPNDLGFLFNPNEQTVRSWVNYNDYTPKGGLRNWGANVSVTSQWLAKPNHFNTLGIGTETWFNTKNLQNLGIWTWWQPYGYHDYFDPRTEDLSLDYHIPKNGNIGFWFNPDRRKSLGFEVDGNYRFYDDPGRYRLNLEFEPIVRFSDQFRMGFEVASYNYINDVGYVTTEDNTVIMGRRNQYTVVNEIEASYRFSSDMSTSLSVRHYNSRVIYSDYHTLQDNGNLGESDFTGLDENGEKAYDIDFNAFTVDARFTWRFAPGSEMAFVWKNGINQFTHLVGRDYFDSLNRLNNAPQSNSLSLKVLYYLDYYTTRQKLRNG